MTEMLAGTALVVAALVYVLYPVLLPRARQARGPGEPRVCPACGERPEIGAVYCSTCGRNLGD